MDSIRNCTNIYINIHIWIYEHVKHLDAQKQNNIDRINICSKDNEIIIQKRN
jgi:hypothetical protein